MSSYNFFASLYDSLTVNVDYEVRSDYISDFFTAKNINNGTIIDLACGTGSFSKLFAEKGYNIIGVDSSADMLTEAQIKLSDINCNFSLINAKMQDFTSKEQVDGVICCLDSINHLTDDTDVSSVFQNVYNSLKNNGLFIFDVNTIYKHQKLLFNKTFIFDEEDYYIVWDNEQIDDREVRILLDFFVYNGDSYDRYSEEFNERAYSALELKMLLEDAGFNSIDIYDELSLNPPGDKSERIYFVCKK
ncbi:MAG: class I SAM-dependent DNA methyltransferase [Eubacterium sp.]